MTELKSEYLSIKVTTEARPKYNVVANTYYVSRRLVDLSQTSVSFQRKKALSTQLHIKVHCVWTVAGQLQEYSLS